MQSTTRSTSQETIKLVYYFFILCYNGIIQLLQQYHCGSIAGAKLTPVTRLLWLLSEVWA